jgi:glycosyltransferase involved in cell wall biosynthesis
MQTQSSVRKIKTRDGNPVLRLKVHHFGPDPAYVGGMGSVIRVLTEHRVGSDTAVLHPTWRPDARFGSLGLALAAALDVMRMRKSEIAHVHLAQKGGVVREGSLVLLARARGVTTVVTLHGSTFLPFARRYPWLVSRILRRAHLITCLDQEVVDFVAQIAPRNRIERVPNPVPMDTESPGVDETEETVVFAGEIGLRKGADVLCRAWQMVADTRPQARCIMVGPIKDFTVPDTERLEVRKPVNAAAMRGLLRTARVVALPSRAEGMPMVLTEAMSGGRPFVSTPVGGIPELAQGGGVLVDVGDDAGLAKWLIAFLADPQLAHQYGEQGRQFCSVTRSVEVVDQQLRALYRTAGQADRRPL